MTAGTIGILPGTSRHSANINARIPHRLSGFHGRKRSSTVKALDSPRCHGLPRSDHEYLRLYIAAISTSGADH